MTSFLIGPKISPMDSVLYVQGSQLGESQNVVVLLHNIGVPFQNNEDRYTWFVQWLLKNVQ